MGFDAQLRASMLKLTGMLTIQCCGASGQGIRLISSSRRNHPAKFALCEFWTKRSNGMKRRRIAKLCHLTTRIRSGRQPGIDRIGRLVRALAGNVVADKISCICRVVRQTVKSSVLTFPRVIRSRICRLIGPKARQGRQGIGFLTIDISYLYPGYCDLNSSGFSWGKVG
jgi:hypothetical protein